MRTGEGGEPKAMRLRSGGGCGGGGRLHEVGMEGDGRQGGERPADRDGGKDGRVIRARVDSGGVVAQVDAKEGEYDGVGVRGKLFVDGAGAGDERLIVEVAGEDAAGATGMVGVVTGSGVDGVIPPLFGRHGEGGHQREGEDQRGRAGVSSEDQGGGEVGCSGRGHRVG